MDLVLLGKNLEDQNPKKEYSKEFLGSKGMNLLTMAERGFNVPPAVIIPVKQCNIYQALSEPNKHLFVKDTVGSVLAAIKGIELAMGKPCLYSVRSGAQISMPGMMDTILNVGIAKGKGIMAGQLLGAAWFDCLRRFYQMYGSVVMGVDSIIFESIISNEKEKAGEFEDSELTHDSLFSICKAMEAIVPTEYPVTLEDQLYGSIQAVWDSWNTERAIAYRNLHNIPHDLGTGIVIQVMVYGNMNDQSGSGVMFTRNPTNGYNKLYGDFLVNAQGEDVVAGVRTPEKIEVISKWNDVLYDELSGVAIDLEKHYKDMQDIEFTVENGELFILQTRTGKRTASASFVIAHDLHKEGLITKEEALKRVSAVDYYLAQQPLIDPDFKFTEIATGIPAGGGIVSGAVVFSADAAVAFGEGCILVMNETTPDAIEGMAVADGILTKIGGVTSHAAVVARSMDTTCIVGCDSMEFTTNGIEFGGVFIYEGDIITIDGNTGKVWVGTVAVIEPKLTKELLYFRDLAFSSTDFIPIGKTYKEGIDNTIAIPYSLYGPENVQAWVKSVKEACGGGYKVYISLRHPTAFNNMEVLSLFGQQIHCYTDEELLGMLGDCSCICTIYEPYDMITLDAVLNGTYSGTPKLGDIQEVFGSKKAYNKIIKLLKGAGEFKMPLVPKLEVTLLKHTFAKGA